MFAGIWHAFGTSSDTEARNKLLREDQCNLSDPAESMPLPGGAKSKLNETTTSKRNC
jgi:hypothetical protein